MNQVQGLRDRFRDMPTEHLICLTIDCDPDGLGGKQTNRAALNWEGLDQARRLPAVMEESDGLSEWNIPVTWFVRADGQLRDILGATAYLLSRFAEMWDEFTRLGHELGWHPHLYRHSSLDESPELIADAAAAVEELERLWEELGNWPFRPKVFRNGEGWHLPETMAAVERLGFECDSTAIPGRVGKNGHPLDWRDAPNQPYFPDPHDTRRAGAPRRLLEIPMNTWMVKAPYDRAARVRYMNPAVHSEIFDQSLQSWGGVRDDVGGELQVWVLIAHPDEFTNPLGPDYLYARDMKSFCRNVYQLGEFLRQAGHRLDFVTLSHAADRWRKDPR